MATIFGLQVIVLANFHGNDADADDDTDDDDDTVADDGVININDQTHTYTHKEFVFNSFSLKIY